MPKIYLGEAFSLIGKTLPAHTALVRQMAAREVSRHYLAVCMGVLTGGGTINAPIARHPVDRLRMSVREDGKPAVTHYRVIERFAAHTYISVQLESGRTHQIRVHLAWRRHPLLGDPLYGGRLALPVGPVAAFTPWNFPINQAVRKIACALASGCSIIVKGPEETPASCAELIRAFVDAGVPAGTVGLVYGVPAEISEYLIPHPIIRKITFTGSTVVGKQLAALAGQHTKRATMELGGHAPAIVFEDADVDAAVKVLAANKYRNAGQVCVAPTRFLIQEKVYDQFVEKFTGAAKALKVGKSTVNRWLKDREQDT